VKLLDLATHILLMHLNACVYTARHMNAFMFLVPMKWICNHFYDPNCIWRTNNQSCWSDLEPLDLYVFVLERLNFILDRQPPEKYI